MTEDDIRRSAITIADNCSRYYTWNGRKLVDDRVEALKAHFKAQLAHVSEAHDRLPDEDRYYRWGMEYAYREALRLLERL